MTDAVVIGAGISGATTALELAEAGLRVTLLDRWGPAAMASGWTLGGVRQSGRHRAELPLARAAVRQWADLDKRLDGETRYTRSGNLRLARTEAEVKVLEDLVAEQSAAGLDVTLLRGADVQATASAVSPHVLAACWCPSDGHADPLRTVQAFLDAGRRKGVQTRFGQHVTRIELTNNRVAAVHTARERIPCGRVVLAAGVMGNELLGPLGTGVPLNIQVVTVLRSCPRPPMLGPVIGVANADCAGRQEADGRWRATSGIMRWNGHMLDSGRPVVHPTASSLAKVVATFGAVVPPFEHAEIEESWAGLIDLTPDGLPVLDRVPGADGLVVAMGFSGHGFGLGPVTGRVMADLALGRMPAVPISAFNLARFAGWNEPVPGKGAGPQTAELHG